MTNIPGPHNKDNHFDEDILKNTGFILSLAGILRADKRLRNKFRVQVLVAELFDLAKAHGYAYCSNLFLSKKMGVSIDTIKRDLKLLEQCEYLRRDTQFSNFKRNRKIFVSDIFSNKFYQGARMTQPSVQECSIEESLSPNVDNKDIPKGISKKVANAPPPPSFSSDVKKLCEHLVEKIQSHGVKFKDPRENKITWFQWQQEMDRLIRIDHHSPKEIMSLIDFSHDDDFWCQNILSPKKLRKHVDKLLLQIAHKDKKTPKEQREKLNREEAKKIVDILKKNPIPKDIKIEACSSGIELGSRSHPKKVFINYSENGFQDQLENELRRMGLFKYLS